MNRISKTSNMQTYYFKFKNYKAHKGGENQFKKDEIQLKVLHVHSKHSINLLPNKHKNVV